MRMGSIFAAAAVLCIALVVGSQPAAASAESDRYARQIGVLCNIDMTKPGAVEQIKRQPAFYWVVAQATTAGLSVSDLILARPALSCDKAIVIDEALASTLITEARKKRS